MVGPEQTAVEVEQCPSIGPGAEEIDRRQHKKVELDAVGKLGPRAKHLGILSARQKIIVLIDDVAERVHERGNLLADRRPRLVDDDQPDVKV